MSSCVILLLHRTKVGAKFPFIGAVSANRFVQVAHTIVPLYVTRFKKHSLMFSFNENVPEMSDVKCSLYHVKHLSQNRLLGLEGVRVFERQLLIERRQDFEGCSTLF